MKLLSTRIRGLGPFADASLDLAALSPEQLLVAVVGENGAGKTTSLELAMLGAVFRTLPTAGGGGSLVSFASMRGASVESLIAIRDGRLVRFRQTVDPVSGSGEAAIIDEATGAPLISSTKVTEADAWVRANLPPLDVVTASLFSAQGSGGVLAMKAADRKRLLLRVHGIERIEKLEAAAAKRARDAKGVRATVQARRDEAGRALVEVSDEDVERAEAGEMASSLDVAAARTHTAMMAGALAEAREKAAALREHDAALDRARQAHTDARRSVETIEVRLKNNREVLDAEDTIRAAHARLDALRADLAAREAELAEAQRKHTDAEHARSRSRGVVEDFARRVREAEREHREAAARYDRHKAAEDAQPAREAARISLSAALEAHDATLAAVADVRAAWAGRREKRIAHLRRGLSDIADGATFLGASEHAGTVLGHDNREIARETSHPETLAAAEHAEREAKAAVARARTRHDAAIAATQGLDPAAREAYRAACERLDDLRGELRVAEERHEARADGACETAGAMTGAALRVGEAHTLVEGAEHELRALPGEGSLERLDAARARIEFLEFDLTYLFAARDTAAAEEARLAAITLPDSNLDLAIVDLERAEHEEHAAREQHSARVAELAALRARAEDARRGRERVATLDTELAAADRELTRWSRLAADLGKDGVQAHLVDAVGPELSALVNELLHACVSTRWTVTIATTRTIATGEAREALELRVMDAESGREGGVETFSGGERVLLGEAISLALTVAACRTAGLEGVSLVRDESGAALDAENARRYVAMLRRAAGMVGASRIYVVTHSEAVQAECDAKVVVEGGALRLAGIEE